MQLIGLAVFTSTSFDIDLPSLVWKGLVRSPVDESDLEVRRAAAGVFGWRGRKTRWAHGSLGALPCPL